MDIDKGKKFGTLEAEKLLMKIIMLMIIKKGNKFSTLKAEKFN
jgi:hypothetical protein